MDQPRIKLYAMAAAYNDGQGQGTVVSGTWLAWNEQCACGEFVSKYYIEGGKFQLTGVAALELHPAQLRVLLDILEKNEPGKRGEVVRLVPREEPTLGEYGRDIPETVALAAQRSDNLRPVSTKYRCRHDGSFGGGGIPTCSGVPSPFCPHCEAVVEEAGADPA